MQTVRNGQGGNGGPTETHDQERTAALGAAGNAPDATGAMPMLPLAPLNQQDTLAWWGTRLPPRAAFAPEVHALVERLASHLSYPLRAERLKLKAMGAIQASEAFEEAVRRVERDTAVRREQARAPLKALEARLEEVGARQADAQDALREAEEALAEYAGRTGLLLADPLAAAPPQVEAALARRLPCGAEAAGMAGTAPAEEHDPAHRRTESRIHLLTAAATGIMLTLSLGTLSGILKSSEFRTPSPSLGIKVGLAFLIGCATEYMVGRFGREVARLVFLHRDGQAAADRGGLPGGGRLTWPLAGALAVLYGMLSVLEGIGLHDLHQQVARLSGSQDPLPLLAYCLIGGAVSGCYLWGHLAGAYADLHNAARLAYQAHIRREAREAWLGQEDSQRVIRLAHRLPILRAEVERLKREETALREESQRLREPIPDPATLALLHDDDENARGERAEFRHDLDGLIEALEPLNRKLRTGLRR